MRLGQLVSSKAGRDQGKHFLIMEIVKDNMVLVADGNLRRVEKPKQKNLRHLIIHPAVSENIEKKLSEEQPITNREVREALLNLGITE